MRGDCSRAQGRLLVPTPNEYGESLRCLVEVKTDDCVQGHVEPRGLACEERKYRTDAVGDRSHLVIVGRLDEGSESVSGWVGGPGVHRARDGNGLLVQPRRREGRPGQGFRTSSSTASVRTALSRYSCPMVKPAG